MDALFCTRFAGQARRGQEGCDRAVRSTACVLPSSYPGLAQINGNCAAAFVLHAAFFVRVVQAHTVPTQATQIRPFI
jgi:hypothetical protein